MGSSDELLYGVFEDETIFSNIPNDGQTFNSVAAAKAQENYCTANGLPRFAPGNGSCVRCGENIYKLIGYSGYSVNYAAGHHITSCPHCHHSFCD